MALSWHSIDPVNVDVRKYAHSIIDNKTKPFGSLGQLENVAVALASILEEQLEHFSSAVVVFAADHGIAEEGVSAFPQAVTHQMVNNFLQGGAAVSVLARSVGAKLLVVDAGVNAEIPDHPLLISRPVAKGTQNFSKVSAMTTEQCLKAMAIGREVIDLLFEQSVNVFVGGEMGIGNTSSSAAIMHAITGLPIGECVGRGTGVDSSAMQRKADVIERACLHHFGNLPADPIHVLACVGGFEIAALVGAFLHAAHRKMVIVVDGFIASVAFLVAAKLEPFIFDYALFAHQSGEHGHSKLMAYMGVAPLLNLQMRLGEGSGATLAIPLLQAAAKIYLEMATFESAGVSEKV